MEDNRVKGEIISEEKVKGRPLASHLFYFTTQSTCPVCKKIVEAQVIEQADRRLFLRKFCPRHGSTESLISSDAEWTINSLGVVKPSSLPFYRSSKVKYGCPEDCGLCERHQQHTCLAHIEITNACNLECPICYDSFVKEDKKWFRTLEDIDRMLDRLIECEGYESLVTFTGGEPTLHPEIGAILEMAKAKGLKNVLINTNGLYLTQDKASPLLKKIKELGVYVYLQFDGFSSQVYETLRGRDVLRDKNNALKRLEEYDISVVLCPTMAKGINEKDIERLIQYTIEKDNIVCLSFQPITYVAAGCKGDTAFNPRERLTLSELIGMIETASQGILKRTDFMIVPCHNPQCGVVTYLIKLEDGVLPITRYIDTREYLDAIKNQSRIKMDDFFNIARSSLEGLMSASALPNMVSNIQNLFHYAANCCAKPEEMANLERKVKQISIHCFMDEYSFDISRTQKCCIHFITPEGKFMPFCNYNLFYRDKVSKWR